MRARATRVRIGTPKINSMYHWHILKAPKRMIVIHHVRLGFGVGVEHTYLLEAKHKDEKFEVGIN